MKSKLFWGAVAALFVIVLFGNIYASNITVDSARSQIPLYPKVTIVNVPWKAYPSEGEFTTPDSIDTVRSFYTGYLNAPQNGWEQYGTTQDCGPMNNDQASLCYAKGKTSVGIVLKRTADNGTHIMTQAADE